MSESARSLMSESWPLTSQDGPGPGAAGAPGDVALPEKRLSLELRLHSGKVLPTVLVTVARLGGEVTFLLARDRDVRMTLVVPGHVAHRVQPLLGGLIGVLAVGTAVG